jgi:hypothetical protein
VTHLWTVDEDVVVPPDAHRLLDVDADIVAARVPVWLGRKDQDGGPRYGLTVPAGAVVQKEALQEFVWT